MKNIIKWVLAIGLSGILVQPIQWLLGLIPWGNFVSEENWTWFIIPRFNFLSVALLVILLIGISYLLKLLSKLNKKNVSKKKEAELKKINTYIDENEGVKITWEVCSESLSDSNPFAYNIQFFCTKHGRIPIRMINGRCGNPNCPNADKSLNEYSIKNNIESILIDAKNKIYE